MTTMTKLPGESRSRLFPANLLTELHPGRILAFGFALWAIVFAAATGMYTWRVGNRALFEAVIPVVLALATTLLGSAYLSRIRRYRLFHGTLIGSIWPFISIAIDLPLFMAGPTRMSISEYLQDIGATYLMIPIITFGLAYQHARAEPPTPK